MKNRNEFKFIELQNSRYSFTYISNGVRYEQINTPSGPNWSLEMAITYAQLQDEIHTQFCNENTTNGEQQYRNHKTTLNGFMAIAGKGLSDRVGIELKSRFDETVNEYVNNLDLGDRTKSDRRSHLNRIKSIYDSLEAKARGETSKLPEELNQVLKLAMASAGISQADLASRAHVSETDIRQLIKGAQPKGLSQTALRRIEQVLGLNRDELTRRVRPSDSNPANKPHQKIEYRERQRSLVTLQYKLQDEEISLGFQEEWQKFFDYKTSELTHLKRNKGSMWRMILLASSRKLSPQACKGKMCSPAAEFIWTIVKSYLGYLRLDKTSGGLGLRVDDVQSIALIAIPELIQSYLEFKRDRSDGIKHGGHKRFAAFVSALTRPEVGFLWQQPQFMEKIPESLRLGRTWEQLCGKSFELAEVWSSSSNEKSRPPEEPIQALLAMPEPTAPIFRAISELDRMAAKAPSGGITQARHKRDALLLAFLLSTPLRARNFRIMKWNTFGTGNLYRTAQLQYRLRFSAGEMKNNKPYDVPVAKWLVNRIEEYIEEFRDVVNKNVETDLLFKFSIHEGDEHASLDKRVLKLTKKLIPETPGFGIHAFRHIVATDWLTKNPNDFMTAADLLGDNLQTVMNNYAHLKRDVAFERYENYLSQRMNAQ